MTPSRSITEQLYQDLCLRFGKKRVGKFSGSKKETKKLIVVATGQALTRIAKDSKEYDDEDVRSLVGFDHFFCLGGISGKIVLVLCGRFNAQRNEQREVY